MRVWRPKNTAYREQHILGTTIFGGGGVTVWRCFSFNCKMDLYVLNSTMTGKKISRQHHPGYRCASFWQSSSCNKTAIMDNNARPHRARIVSDYLRQESIDSIPWPAMSPDMNPIEHLWDDIGRKINDHVPACQNLQELCDALVQEWQSIPLRTLRHLVQSMRRTCWRTFPEAWRLHTLLTTLVLKCSLKLSISSSKHDLL
jgi:hypothetical protein